MQRTYDASLSRQEATVNSSCPTYGQKAIPDLAQRPTSDIASARACRPRAGDLRGRFFAEPPIEDAAECAANERGDPEEPQLGKRPPADEERRAGAARRVDRGVGDRDAHQVDEGEAEPDGDRREA